VALHRREVDLEAERLAGLGYAGIFGQIRSCFGLIQLGRQFPCGEPRIEAGMVLESGVDFEDPVVHGHGAVVDEFVDCHALGHVLEQRPEAFVDFALDDLRPER